MTIEEARNRIDAAFRTFASASDASQYSPLLPPAAAAGKLYEAFVLTKVAELLVTREGMNLTLMNSNNIALKSAPGPINRRYPRIDVTKPGKAPAELWTDVEFLSLSYCLNGTSMAPGRGDYHELDILMVEAGLDNERPNPHQIRLGVECKNSGYGKKLLKEILGIRRELSLLAADTSTGFSSWPRSLVPADPPVCLMVFSSDPGVTLYSAPGRTFGIDFLHEAL